uniref:Uncharacterized protein n=1 Tax=Anguilla anguilla TaxID=7936 RepID=A0A0E9THG0_ANGAN
MTVSNPFRVCSRFSHEDCRVIRKLTDYDLVLQNIKSGHI